MIFERITTPTHPLYADAIDLYKISFPHHEQRKEASQTEIRLHPAYHFDVVCDGGAFVGEILYQDIGNALYMEHFCVLPSMRNRPYGQKILAALQKHPLILEIDPDDLEPGKRLFHTCRAGLLGAFRVSGCCWQHPGTVFQNRISEKNRNFPSFSQHFMWTVSAILWAFTQ